MNRAQRRKLIQMPKGKPKHNTASAEASNVQTGVTAQNAQGIIDNLPLPQLVAGINNLLKQLEQRGVPIYDWDDNGRTLYRLQMRRGKVFYLAAGEAPEPEAKNPEKE